MTALALDPTPLPKRRLRASDRRQVILDAAAQCFAAMGYAGTSMDEVAAASQVSKPVLYDHFRSKLELYTQLISAIRDDLIQEGRNLAESRPSLDRIGFAQSAAIFFRFARSSPSRLRLLTIPPEGDPLARQAHASVQAGAAAQIAAMLEALSPGSPPDEILAKAVVLKAGMHALALWADARPDWSPEKLGTLVADMVWSGVAEEKSPDVQSPQRRG